MAAGRLRSDPPVALAPVAPGSGAGEGAAVAALGPLRPILGPDSRVEALRARPRELRKAIYGAKNELWVRFSKAETREQARLGVMIELGRRHAAATEGAPVLAPRIVKTPREPTAIERAEHMVTHMPQQPWCDYCVLGYGASKSHERRTFEQKDTSRAMVYIDYAYKKTNREFVPSGMASPAVADLFAITLIMIDRDTLCMRAISMPTRTISD